MGRVEYWKIKGTECALNRTQIPFKWPIDSVTIFHVHTICVRFRVFIYGELLECARFLEKNVWRIIEKASLPIKIVGTKLKGTPF